MRNAMITSGLIWMMVLTSAAQAEYTIKIKSPGEGAKIQQGKRLLVKGVLRLENEGRPSQPLFVRARLYAFRVGAVVIRQEDLLIMKDLDNDGKHAFELGLRQSKVKFEKQQYLLRVDCLRGKEIVATASCFVRVVGAETPAVITRNSTSAARATAERP